MKIDSHLFEISNFIQRKQILRNTQDLLFESVFS